MAQLEAQNVNKSKALASDFNEKVVPLYHPFCNGSTSSHLGKGGENTVLKPVCDSGRQRSAVRKKERQMLVACPCRALLHRHGLRP